MPRKRDPNNQRVINRDINAALRAEQAIALRARKFTWEMIARTAGYASPGAARNAVQREMDRRIVANVDELRREEGETLDELQRAVFIYAVGNPDVTFDEDDDEDERKDKRRARKPGLFAMDRVLAIMERRAKLFGLDKPVMQAQPVEAPEIVALPTEWVANV